MVIRRALALGASLLGAAVIHAQLSPAEVKGLEDVLTVGNFTRADLRFERKPFRDPYRLPVIDDCLDDPVSGAEELMRWHAAAHQVEAAASLAVALDRAYAKGPQVAAAKAVADTVPPSVSADVRQAVLRIVSAMQATDGEIRKALAGLKPAEVRELIESLPTWAVEEPKVKFDFVKSPPAGQARILSLLDKVDLARIRGAGLHLAQAVEGAKVLLKGNWSTTPLQDVRFTVAGLPVLLSGTGTTVHTESDVRLTIDFGGDDVYRGRHGAGVGYSSVLIDLGGDDTFAVRDLSVGAGVLGVGIANVTGGNDRFGGKSLCYGAGLAGVGLFQKTGGDDNYDAVALAQGFGQFGVGICADTGGWDTYAVKLFGQGAARTQGVGWLIDHSGHDKYWAGGLSMNSPLFTGVSYSNAQGFSSGYREDSGGLSGGVGLLTDFSGADFYLGETYLQATSYWFSVGSLYDMSGNDTYSAYHYAQASAMHCCSAYLFDLGGDDAYVTKYGASLAIGHDYGLALLLDRAGDDLFTARDSTPGVGTANGLGVFIDSAGTDRFDGPAGQGNPARGTGSLGVFVDLAGPDKHRAGLADGRARLGSNWGVAWDQETTTAAPVAAQAPPPPTPGSEPNPGEAALAQIYTKASQWGVGSAQAEVAENTNRLIAIGLPAFEWMLDNRLAAADRLQIRTFVAVVKALGVDGAAAMGARALRAATEEKRKLVQIATDANVTDFGAILAPMLDDPELRLQAARAAGPLKATGCVDGLVRLCLNSDRLLVRAAMVSLAQLADPSTHATALAMLKSTDMPTRMAAFQLLASQPGQAVLTGRTLVEDNDESFVRYGLKLIALPATPESMEEVAKFLLDPRPGVRIEAIQLLARRCPPASQKVLDSLANDPVAIVRAVAKAALEAKS